jgi:hypothetical protein
MVLPFNVESIISEEKGLIQPFGINDRVTDLACWLGTWIDVAQKFVGIQYITANTPFIMSIPNSGIYDDKFNVSGLIYFYARNAIVYASQIEYSDNQQNITLRASYQEIKSNNRTLTLNTTDYITDYNNVIMPGGAFVLSSRNIKPFEAYMYNSLENQNKTCIRIVDESSSSIDEIILNPIPEPNIWYNLQGIPMIGKPDMPGLYIHNGKKVIIN